MAAYRNGILVEPAEGYNGWTNYPTWAVKLWIDNDEGSQSYWAEQAREVAAIEPLPPELTVLGHDETCRHTLAGQLQDEHADAWQDLPPIHGAQSFGVFDDLMSYALGCVNWYEIAESLLSEVSES